MKDKIKKIREFLANKGGYSPPIPIHFQGHQLYLFALHLF